MSRYRQQFPLATCLRMHHQALLKILHFSKKKAVQNWKSPRMNFQFPLGKNPQWELLRYRWMKTFIFLFVCTINLHTHAQEAPLGSNALPANQEENEITPKNIRVKAVADDKKIADRLRRILEASGWFQGVSVEVSEGIVFLRGSTDTPEHQEWAGQLAGKTEDVVVVVNKIEIDSKNIWNFSPAWSELNKIGTDFLRGSPLILFSVIMLLATWFVSRFVMFVSKSLLKNRLKSAMLRNIFAKGFASIIFLMGLYLILRVSGLTRLAVTVIGSTGLLGLIIGFAFRDITENFLASILLSMQQPFAKSDLIQVREIEGFVLSINTRHTLLMTRSGNHVQIPNAIIYKEIVTNFTANPNTRFEFKVGIGYEDSISDAQSVALKVLQNYHAVIKDPGPLVLVDNLGGATVNLRVIFWIDITRYSFEKVKSAIIRLVKEAFVNAGISMPDEAREIIFPNGVPVHMISDGMSEEREGKAQKVEEKVEDAEGGLSSNRKEIEEQANQSRKLEVGTDLLEKS